MEVNTPSEARFKGVRDFALLFRGNLVEIRMDWVWYVAFLSFSSIMFLVFLWLTLGRANPGSALYIITGSLTQSLTSAGMLSLGQEIGSMKNSAIFDHYAALPISKVSFVAALVSKALLFALPSLVFSLLFAGLVLGIRLYLNPYVFVAVLLGGYSLVGLGAMVGFYSKTGRVAGLATQYISPIITFLAPVFVAKESLPRFLQVTSTILPTTYVASAFRHALSGETSAGLMRDLVVLAAWTIGSLLLVFPRLDWRGRRN